MKTVQVERELLEEAARLVKAYADCVLRFVPADHLEEFDYQPAIEEAASDLQQALSSGEPVCGACNDTGMRPVGDGYSVDACECASPTAPAQVEGPTWQHLANEWADIATSGLVWLENVRNGYSSTDVAIENMKEIIADVRDKPRPAALPPSQPEAVAWMIRHEKLQHWKQCIHDPELAEVMRNSEGYTVTPLFLTPPEAEATIVLRECDEYLDSYGEGTSIGRGSALHRKMKAVLNGEKS